MHAYIDPLFERDEGGRMPARQIEEIEGRKKLENAGQSGGGERILP